MTSQTNKKAALPIAAAVGISAIGLIFASIGGLYLAGMFGISTALASQIVAAVQIGGWALAIVMGMLSGGTAAVAIGTARWAIARMGEKAAVA